MRIVVRSYKDGKTKPHIDEYKTDCNDFYQVDEVTEDIRGFIRESLDELKEQEEDNDESD